MGSFVRCIGVPKPHGPLSTPNPTRKPGSSSNATPSSDPPPPASDVSRLERGTCRAVAGTSSYDGVDIILISTAFNPTLNGWSNIDSEPSNCTLWASGGHKNGYTNTNFICNDASGPTVTNGFGTLFLDRPGGDGLPVDLWAFDQNNQFLVGPFGGVHQSSISLTAAVPEPASYAMLLAGGRAGRLMLGLARARRQRRASAR